jgi:hypothetical protein
MTFRVTPSEQAVGLITNSSTKSPLRKATVYFTSVLID